MSDKPKLSRRDWFRLRLPHQDQQPEAAHSIGVADANTRPIGLQTIEHPPNHDGMNLDDLPPLREAVLTDKDVVAMLRDIQHNGSEIQLMQKRGAKNSHATVDSTSFDAATERFVSGRTNRLQIRYRWQGSLWIDTLARQQTGVRLVRVSHKSQ